MKKSKDILIPYFLAIPTFLFVALPLFNGYLDQKAILAFETKKLEQQDAYFDEMIRVKNKLAPHESVLKDIKRALPADPALPSLIKHLKELTTDSGLHLEGIDSFLTVDSPKRPHLKETTLRMAVIGGNYASMKGFMREIERSARIISINNAKMSSVVGGDGESRFLLSLSLKTYSD